MHNKNLLAVQASLLGNWEEAIALNSEILTSNPNDIKALSRLGLAFSELGQLDSAKEIYERILTIDRYNAVATRCLKNLSSKKPRGTFTISTENFIEEPGLTKTTELIKVAGRDTLLALTCKQLLTFSPRARLIAVKNETGETIGCLPDDLSLRLARLSKNGYSYSVCVKAVGRSEVSVFIREVKRPARALAAPSFSRSSNIKPKLKKA